MYNTSFKIINELSNLESINFNNISDIFLKDTKRQYITGLLFILFGIVLLSIGQN
jgi:hypothetical protein|tara:strand:+ start:189 stop:353 length:165 start_codon:yes stop_codon:yes gene_type:complete